MKWSRAVRWLAACSATLATWGCAQIAGLTSDYHLADGGVGGATGEGGGAEAASGGTEPRAGAAGASAGGAPTGGAAGESGGSGPSGGSSPSGGTKSKGGAGGVAGTTGGASGAAGGGVAGAAGNSAQGPVRIGYSEFHDSAAGNDNASSHLASATFTKPLGTAKGDFMLVFFGADHALMNLSGTDLSGRGWTLVDQHEGLGTDGQGTYLMYKFAGAAEPDPIVFADINSVPSGNGVQGLLSVYRGVDPAMPVNAYEVSVTPMGQENITLVSTPTPAITTTVAGCLLIAGLSPDSAIDAPVVTSWPSGFPDTLSVNNPPHPYPGGWANIYVAEGHVAAAGTVAASHFAWTPTLATAYYGSLSFVIALAPAP